MALNGAEYQAKALLVTSALANPYYQHASRMLVLTHPSCCTFSICLFMVAGVRCLGRQPWQFGERMYVVRRHDDQVGQTFFERDSRSTFSACSPHSDQFCG